MLLIATINSNVQSHLKHALVGTNELFLLLDTRQLS